MKACDLVQGHLSLPCSLGRNAEEIGTFLVSPSFDFRPELFLKLYLMLLGEFNSLLRDATKFMDLPLEKEPRLTAQWTNCWAKHALSILVQHHPTFVFADDLGPDWAKYQQSKDSLMCVSPTGERAKPQIIDLAWMCQYSHRPDLNLANSGDPPAIVVPPLREFLIETIDYFRTFKDGILNDPCRLQIFEKTEHVHWRATVS